MTQEEHFITISNFLCFIVLKNIILEHIYCFVITIYLKYKYMSLYININLIKILLFQIKLIIICLFDKINI